MTNASLNRIESADLLTGMIDKYGFEWAIKVLIRDQDDKIESWKGANDRVVKSWHDQAVKRKDLLMEMIGATNKANYQEQDPFQSAEWHVGAKNE